MLGRVRAIKFNFWLFGVLILIFLLRLPSFSEPYWYGDEGIYLAIGQALQRGAVLYRDIWDNKPPLLYLIYALQPTLLWAKISATVFVLGTCAGVYFLSLRLFKGKWSSVYSLLTTTITGILLSIPLLEGTIANAELYFTLPIVWAAVLIINYKLAISGWRLYVIGLLMSAAFLLKVPAVFDFAGLFLFLAVDRLRNYWRPLLWREYARELYDSFLPVIVGFLAPLVLVFLYFLFNGALKDFLVASFSQNASYVAIDSGPFSKLTNPLFIKGIILVAGGLLLVAGYFKKILSKELLFLFLWFGFSLYGALLSNRPYMHYLLQIVPPAVVLFVYLFVNIRKYSYVLIIYFFVVFVLMRMFTGAFALPTRPYFQNWFDFQSERELWEDYVTFFDSRTLNSYAVAGYLQKNTDPDDPIFVWGDASFVYVLSNRPAATKFIQAHHLTTIDPVNYDLVIQRLEQVQPKFILISRPAHFQFPKLEELVAQNYRQVAVFADLHVYKIN